MPDSYRIVTAPNNAGMTTIVDNGTNLGILGTHDGTPVFADRGLAERVLAYLNVALTDEEDLYVADSGECCSDHCVADVHDLRLDQAERLVEVLAARDQALREKIASQIEAKYLGPDSGRSHDGREAPDAALRNAHDEGLETAARIARGEAR